MLEPSERLRKAIIGGNLAITKRLLARFPDLWLNIDPSHKGWCNLHYASFHGHYLICFHLVSGMNRLRKHPSDDMPTFCDLDLVTFDDLTVLHMPLLHHHSQTLHFLLQEFSGHKWLNYKGGPLSRTPLHYCCVSGFADGLTLLLEFGADWTLVDSNGDTCLHLCFAYGDLKCIEILYKYVMSRALQRGDPGDGTSPKKSAANSIVSGHGPVSRDSLRARLFSVISDLENTPNARGQFPVAFSSSFDTEERYFASKNKWVDKTLDDELALKTDHSQWDASSSVFEFSADKYSRAPYSSPGVGSLANYRQIASISRTSLDSDLADTSSPKLDPMPPWVPVPEAKNKETKAEGSQTPVHASTHDWKGRKHSRSLPSSADSDPAVHTESVSKPSRPHKHLPFFRGSPLMGRSATVSSASSQNPISPLQVEFTSAQTRRMSLASSGRSPQKSESGSHSGDGPRRSLEKPPNTPTSSSFVSSLVFSPLSAIRNKSATEIEPDTQQEPTQKSQRKLSKFPSSSQLKKKASSDSLKRNFSTPSILANVFRGSSDTPTTTLNQSRRPSLSEVSYKLSPAKSISSQAETSDGSPTTRHMYPSSIAESSDDSEKKFVFTISRDSKSASQTSLPTLRMRHSYDLQRGSTDEQSPPQNVRSISFASVREE